MAHYQAAEAEKPRTESAQTVKPSIAEATEVSQMLTINTWQVASNPSRVFGNLER
jgi:hypothetical protein